MRTFLPAFLERAFPRLFSAALMLLVARLTSPYDVGVYTYAVIAYTAVNAMTDGAARQVVLRAITEDEGEAFLRRYEFVASTLGFVGIGLVIVGLRLGGVIPSWSTAADLTPFMFAPIFTSLCLRHIGRLQFVGRWRELARGQLLASVLSVVAAVPVLLLTHSLLGPSLQTLVAEATFFAFCRHLARSCTVPRLEPSPEAKSIGHDLIAMSAFQLVSWAQGQSERIFVGGLAGTPALGIYSTGSALGRAPGDALGASTMNLVRAAIADKAEPEAVRAAAHHVLGRSLVLAVLSPVSTILAAIGLYWFLGPTWREALEIVPILSLVAFPAVLSWSASVLQVKAGKAMRAIWAPITGIAMAILIAMAATHSLKLAAYLVVIREVVVLTLAFTIIKRWVPWRAYCYCIAIVALGIASCLLVLGV